MTATPLTIGPSSQPFVVNEMIHPPPRRTVFSVAHLASVLLYLPLCKIGGAV